MAHGYNVLKGRSSWPHTCAIAEALQLISIPNQKKLLGNGWHLAVIGSWLCYILCHTVKLDEVMPTIQPEKTLLRRGGSDMSSSLRRGKSTLSLATSPSSCAALETSGSCAEEGSENDAPAVSSAVPQL